VREGGGGGDRAHGEESHDSRGPDLAALCHGCVPLLVPVHSIENVVFFLILFEELS